jgi:hypothetical protein
MTNDQIIAIVKFLIDLKAENLALWKVLARANLIPASFPPPEMSDTQKMVASLHTAAASLPRTGLSGIPTLLDTLSRIHPV